MGSPGRLPGLCSQPWLFPAKDWVWEPILLILAPLALSRENRTGRGTRAAALSLSICPLPSGAPSDFPLHWAETRAGSPAGGPHQTSAPGS